MKCARSRFTLFASFMLIVFVTVLYFPVREFEFINFDDNVYITANPPVAAGLSLDGVRWAFSGVHGGHWHPLSWIAHMLDVSLFGFNAGAHHLVSVAWHAINTVLVFHFLIALGRFTPLLTTGLALFLAALWGVHPLRLESVAWVSERKDVLSMFFGLLTGLLYLRYISTPTFAKYGALCIVFVCGLLSKPSLVTLPLLFLLLDFWPLGRMAQIKMKALVCEKLPFIALSFISGIVTSYSQFHDGALQSLDTFPLGDRIANALTSYQAYLGKFFYPSGLGIFYPFKVLSPGIGAGCFVGLLAITWLCFTQQKTRPYLLCGWLWFLISLAPVIGIIQVGGQALADRWTYLSHIGLLIALGPGFQEVMLRYFTQFRLTLCASCVVFVYALITYSVLPVWKNSETLFSHTLRVSPNNFMAHLNLGVALQERGDSRAALFHYEEAVRLNPTYPEALNNLGIARAQARNFSEAERLFRRSISINPRFPDARYNLGLVLSETGRALEAITFWVTTLHFNPNYHDARVMIRSEVGRNTPILCARSSSNEDRERITRGGDGLRVALQEWSADTRDFELKGQISTLLECLQ